MTSASGPAAKTKTFLEQASHFKLGHLPTEQQNPQTTNLSHLAKNDLPQAIELLKKVEQDALKAVTRKLDAINEMSDTIRATLKSGGRIFFGGCGATGRLSLSLETLWREEAARLGRHEMKEKVFSFIAGGDYALVRSIENFEDHPEYGARQLTDLGFKDGDLMIGCSEGGETPFVIGAVEEAVRIGKQKAYFLFCNPTELLKNTVERSKRVIENPKVTSIAIETGPMALAGSTRLQATSALMLAAGSALFSTFERLTQPIAFIDELQNAIKASNFEPLTSLIEAESKTYADGDACVHRTSVYAITVITDTTERSPTFSLAPFEFVNNPDNALSWTYLIFHDPRTPPQTSLDSWKRLLNRPPRPLTWEGFKEKYGEVAIENFDFTMKSQTRREERAKPHEVYAYDIECGARDIILKFRGHEARFHRPASQLSEHLLLKCAMNISSTLVMGRLGRFESNLMLYVRAANNKLVDRAIRYVQILLKQAGIEKFSYEEICAALFETVEHLKADEPAVLRTFEKLKS